MIAVVELLLGDRVSEELRSHEAVGSTEVMRTLGAELSHGSGIAIFVASNIMKKPPGFYWVSGKLPSRLTNLTGMWGATGAELFTGKGHPSWRQPKVTQSLAFPKGLH